MPYGPCTVCGKTNYPLSMGGPGICPSCDCGNAPNTVMEALRPINLPDDVGSLTQEIRDLKNCLIKSGMCKSCSDKLKCITKDKDV